MMKYLSLLGILTCLLAGCDNGSRHVEPEPSALASPASTPQPPHSVQPEPTYTMPPNLCRPISWEAFTDTYPDRDVRQMAELGRKDDPERGTTATCTAFVGEADDGLFLTIEAGIYLHAAVAAEQYARSKTRDTHRLSTVKRADAIGTAAYTMYDRLLGSALVVVHGNAFLRFSIRDLGTAGHIPLGDPAQRLRKLAAATIVNLPQIRPTALTTWPPVGRQP